MATNIYNPTTGQTGYQVPGAALQAGWQWGSMQAAPPVSAPAPVTPTVPTNTGSVPSPYMPPTLYNASTGMMAAPTPGTTLAQTSSALANGWTTTAPATPAAPVTPAATPNPTPVIPTNTGGGSSSIATDPTATSNEMLKSILGLMTPSSDETSLMSTLAGQEASRRQSVLDINNQPIATPFLTGQAAAVNNAVNASEANTQGALTLAQNKRLASLDAAKTVFDYAKPTTLGLGTNLVNPLTGQTIAQGQSYTDKLGASNVLSLSRLYPDAGILPTDSPDIAAQKASQAPSFIAKYGKASYQWNPNTGTFDLLATNRLGITTPGASYGGNPNGNGGQSNFGVAPSGGSSGSSNAGIGGGSIVDYLNSIGKDSSFNSRATIAQNAGIQNYTGTAQQNTQLLNMLRSAEGSGGGATAGGMASVPIGNGGTSPAPAAVSSGSPFGLNLANKIDNATLAYIQTGDMPTGVYPADQAAVRARANAVIPGFNPAVAKANAKAIGEQTSQQADTSRAITAADSNFGLLTQTFQKAGVNDLSSPLANQFNNWIQKGIIGNSDVINFQSAVSTLQTEYATVLGRGGEVTDSVRKSAQNVISGNYSMSDLISLHDYIDKEGKNVIDSYTKTIRDLATGGIGSGGAGPGTSGGGSSGTTPSGINYTIH